MNSYLTWLNIDWQAVEAIGTGVAAAVVILAGIIAKRQLAEMRRGRNAQIAFQLFSELRSEKMKNCLRKIYKLDGNKIPPEMEDDVSDVMDRIEFLGILVANKVIDEDLVLKAIKQPLRVWYKLREYIRSQRQKTARGHYGSFAEYLAHLSLKYQNEKVPPSQWTRLNGVDLVTTLREELLNLQKPVW